MKYDVFISYSRADLCFENNTINPDSIVSKVLKTLDENNISYWIDKEGVYSGSEFADIIGQAIEDSRTFVFISTESSNKSEWTPGEIASAKEIKHPIIPFRVDDFPYSRKIRIIVAPLDFIDYKQFGDKAFAMLVSSLNKHLSDIKAEEDAEQRRQELASEKYKAEERRKQELVKIQAQYDAKCSMIQDEIEAKHTKLENLLKEMGKLGLDTSEYNDNQLVKLQREVHEKESEIIRLKEEFANFSLKSEESLNALKQKYSRLQSSNQSLSNQIKNKDINEQRIKKSLERNRSLKWISVLLAWLCLVALGVVCTRCIKFKKECIQNRDKYVLSQSENNKLKDEISKIKEGIPIIITDIKIGNVYKDFKIETDYGKRIIASNTMYLAPQITYNCMAYVEMPLYVKLFGPDGKLRTGKTSPEGYTYKDDCNFLNGDKKTLDLMGWGNEKKGYWSAGKYRLEIYYKDIYIASKEFEIYEKELIW